MSYIRINSLELENFRSFKDNSVIKFPEQDYKKPVSIIGYNNAGKTNLMNAILYGIGYKYVNEDTFELKDIYNLDRGSKLLIKSNIDSSYYINPWDQKQGAKGKHLVTAEYNLENGVVSKRESIPFESGYGSPKSSLFNIDKEYNVFYINFHEIKNEINTKKMSWGKISSFLGKHIQSIIDEDIIMKNNRDDFMFRSKKLTDDVMHNSKLENFIGLIQDNYKQNLRGNNCNIEFTLPDYEDIFLNMIFKIGLNNNNENLIPIDHFGDGYISMFIMAVIQAIGENSQEDKCLFLFEEPESFLHENHQEYFYKKVLCNLAERGHQVIFTTHSAKMMDIFDIKSIIRLDFDNKNNKTILSYNKPNEDLKVSCNENIISIKNYNAYIKSIEPNLNKILFSKKVIFVEGPNDLMVYKYIIENKVKEYIKEQIKKGNKYWVTEEYSVINYANLFLNFENIAIIPHHGKSTVHLLVDLCKHFEIDYFVITDFDFEEDFSNELLKYNTKHELMNSKIYNIQTDSNKKGMITTNWQILKNIESERLHFNVNKLETVLNYNKNDKDSINIWNKLNDTKNFKQDIFPDKLFEFLNIRAIHLDNISGIEEIPF